MSRRHHARVFHRFQISAVARHRIALGVVCLAGILPGCGDLPEDAQGATQPIIDGSPESGFAAVGALAYPNGQVFCTATLIAPDMVLSAGHCMNNAPLSGFRFNIGNNASQFVPSFLRRMSVSPGFQPGNSFSIDIAIVQLSVPITNVTPIPFNRGGLPRVGGFCATVGFGEHNEADGSWTSGMKRSAVVQIRSADWDRIDAGNFRVSGTGLPGHGDSGGPLICNGVVVAVVQAAVGDLDQQTIPDSESMTAFTTAKPAWVQGTIDQLRTRDMWRACEPSPISSQQSPYFAITTADRNVPYILYAKVPFGGEKLTWQFASTTSDPPGNLADLSGPALVALSRPNGVGSNFQVFVTGGNRALLEKHQSNGAWRSWGRVAPTLPASRIGSAPAAVARRSQVDGLYKDPVVAITDERGIMWAIVASLNSDGSNRWGTWSQLKSGTAAGALKFSSAPALWADSFGNVRVVGVAGTRAFETTFNPANGSSSFWQEIPGGGIFASGLSASFRTDFEFTHSVDYAGLGSDVVSPFSDSFSLLDGSRTGWQPIPPLEWYLPANSIPDSSPMVGSDYTFEEGHRPFVLMRSREANSPQWYWRLVTDSYDKPWRKMLR